MSRSQFVFFFLIFRNFSIMFFSCEMNEFSFFALIEIFFPTFKNMSNFFRILGLLSPRNACNSFSSSHHGCNYCPDGTLWLCLSCVLERRLSFAPWRLYKLKISTVTYQLSVRKCCNLYSRRDSSRTNHHEMNSSLIVIFYVNLRWL